MAKERNKTTPINREKFLTNLPDPYQIPEQDLQPYDNSNPNAKFLKPGQPEFNRAGEISLKGDTNGNINITLEDHDEAVLYYIKNYIKPTVEINGSQREVPVIYGSPERWKSMQKDGFFRDKNGKAFIPIIAVKRESFEKDRRLGNKLDGNKVQNVQYFKTGYSKRNGYDNFSVLQNQIPSIEYQVGVIPDYITLTYKLSIFTDYVEHMNNIIEAIEFASDSYWGDKERFQFRASISSYPTPTQVENGNDRGVKSELTLTINGYIIPKTINVQKAAPTPKSFNITKIRLKEYIESNSSPIIDSNGNKIINFNSPDDKNIAYYGVFNGTFIGDASQLTNLPTQSFDTDNFVPKTRTLTINGETQDLSEDISFTVGATSKRSYFVEWKITGAMAASTNWFAQGQLDSLGGIFVATAGITPTNNFADYSIQTPCYILPFNAKIKSYNAKGFTNGNTTAFLRSIVNSSFSDVTVNSNTIQNALNIADVSFQLGYPGVTGNFFRFQTDTGFSDVTLPKGTEIRLFNFNNNQSTPLQSTIILIEFEEVL